MDVRRFLTLGRGPAVHAVVLAAALHLLPGSALHAQLLLEPQGQAAQLSVQQTSSTDQAGLASAIPVDPSHLAGLQYRFIGPTRGGRVTAVAGHRSHPRTFYMGSTGGGVWKTDDNGISWYNLSDGYFQTAPIGVIRVAESNPDVVWVGTGSDGIRSNIIIGKGMYRSTDAGESWEHVGLENAGQIGRMVVHPENPDVAWVAAIGSPFGKNPERGIYRTRDGGQNWEQIYHHSDSVGVYGIVAEPGNPDILYMSTWRGERKPWTIISGMEASAGAGIFKSSDGGDNWTMLTNGLPSGLVGKIDIAISPAAPQRVYAIVEAPGEELGLYVSEDAGATWEARSNQRGLMDRPFYYTNVHVDPINPDRVYASATAWWVSDDAGRTFARRPTPHGDNHDMWINPDNPDHFIQANDGGVNVTLDGGRSWSTQLNQPTAELYQADLDDAFPYWIYAGQQDNTTIAVPSQIPAVTSPSGPEGLWREVGGCETGPSVPRPGDPDIIYASCKGRFGRFNMRTGQEKQYYVGAANLYGHNPADLEYRLQRTVPVVVSPHNPDVVYHTSQFVHRTTDEGVTWEIISPDLTAFRPERQVVSGGPITRDITGEEHYSVLYAFAESPIEPGVLWAGANDGPVHVSRTNGESWTEVTPPMPPEGRVNKIWVSNHRPGKAYVAAYRFLLNDFTPYLFRTTDYGQSWTLLTDGTNGIPGDFPVRAIAEDPDREGLLYAGTEFGMFLSLDDGATWQDFQQNLPVTPISDIRVWRDDLVISTMGRGFWIMDNLTPLQQLSDDVRAARAHLFEPRDAVRMRLGGFGLGGGAGSSVPGSGAPTTPQYPEVGVEIDYYFAAAPAGEVTLEILDPAGEVIRGFTSTGQGYQMELRQEMRAPEMVRVGGARVPVGEGAHRFVWDMAAPGPWTPDGLAGRGPLVVPGQYSVRIRMDGWSETRAFQILPDPRVVADGVTTEVMEEQFALAVEVREVLSEARRTTNRLAVARRDLEAAQVSGRQEQIQAVLQELLEIERALLQEPGVTYPQPMIVQQLEYLYSMLNRADQKPGRDAYIRLEQLEAQLEEQIQRLERVLARTVSQEGIQ
jgi:photosystem II stability/assembly factor-like uncharacterized protein/predicted RNA-binding protein YlxR (DUF448 family)